MTSRVVKDIQLDTAGSYRTLRIPVIDIVTQFPAKGNFAYNRPDETAGIDGILYYADGTKWIPLISGLGNNLIAGAGISIVAGGGNITISNVATLSNIGTDPNGSLIPGSPQSPPSYTVRGLLPGVGISLSVSATDVTITNADPASDVTLTDAGVVDPHQTLVVDGTGPSLSVKGIQTTSTGISVATSGNNNIVITNTDPASSVTLTDGGVIDPHQSLVIDGVGPALAVKGVQSTSTGITVATSGNGNLVITNTDPGSAVTLADAGNGAAPGHVNMVVDGTGPALSIRGLIPGNGIGITAPAAFDNQDALIFSDIQQTVMIFDDTVPSPFQIPAEAIAPTLSITAAGGGGGGSGTETIGFGNGGGGGGGSGSQIIELEIQPLDIIEFALGTGGAGGAAGNIGATGGSGGSAAFQLTRGVTVGPTLVLGGGIGGGGGSNAGIGGLGGAAGSSAPLAGFVVVEGYSGTEGGEGGGLGGSNGFQGGAVYGSPFDAAGGGLGIGVTNSGGGGGGSTWVGAGAHGMDSNGGQTTVPTGGSGGYGGASGQAGGNGAGGRIVFRWWS